MVTAKFIKYNYLIYAHLTPDFLDIQISAKKIQKKCVGPCEFNNYSIIKKILVSSDCAPYLGSFWLYLIVIE